MGVIKLYLPKAVGEPTRNNVKRHFASAFGGYTVYDAEGGWVNDDGKIIEEDCVVIETAANDHPKELRNFARRQCSYVNNASAESEVMAVVEEGETVVVP